MTHYYVIAQRYKQTGSYEFQCGSGLGAAERVQTTLWCLSGELNRAGPVLQLRAVTMQIRVAPSS